MIAHVDGAAELERGGANLMIAPAQILYGGCALYTEVQGSMAFRGGY